MADDREISHADALLKSSKANITQADGSTSEQNSAPLDPNDEIPVPIAMAPAEIDERAQVVEALRGKGPPPRTDTQVDP
ncbi:MAG TPA: hypothetical protein VK636_02625 [Gemmatimonadaceae bacterium]|nr:hypothetical protein [Gemmatimonadaceae bacterium]